MWLSRQGAFDERCIGSTISEYMNGTVIFLVAMHGRTYSSRSNWLVFLVSPTSSLEDTVHAVLTRTTVPLV